MVNSCDKLPADLVLRIVRQVADRDDNHKVKLAPYATVSRAWQTAIESSVFRFHQKPLSLGPNEIADFSRVFAGPRRCNTLEWVRLEVVVPSHLVEGQPGLWTEVPRPRQSSAGGLQQAVIREFVSSVFHRIFSVLGSWAEGKRSLNLEYAIAWSTTKKDWTHGTFQRRDSLVHANLTGLSRAPVVARFAHSEDSVSMALSPVALDCCIQKLPGLRCASLSFPMHLDGSYVLPECQEILRGLGTKTPFLTHLSLDLNQQKAPSFSASEATFEAIIPSLLNLARQLQHLCLKNVASPGRFLLASRRRSRALQTAAWPVLLSFDIAGFYQKDVFADMIRHAATVDRVRRICPHIAEFRVAVLVWPSGNPFCIKEFVIHEELRPVYRQW